MNYKFEAASIQFEVEYRKVKVLRLTVYPPDGRVKITAPLGTTQEFIRKFAASKTGWVEEQRQKFQKNKAQSKSKTAGALKNNSTVFIWGQAFKLEIIERNGHPKILVNSGSVKFYVRPDSTRAKRLGIFDKWYRNVLKEAAASIIEKWEKQIGVQVKKLYVQKMKTHWGSCNYERHTLRLNSELAKRDPLCLEYVVVHEMLHIIEKNHNSNYYRLMNKYFPGWKAIRKRMNSNEF